MNPELLKSIEDACIKNIKSEGAFDKLRSECLGEIEKEHQFQHLNAQIEDQVINFVKAKNRSISSQPKSEVRKGVRSHLNSQLNGLLKSQLDSLVDSIIKSQEAYLKEIVKEAVDSFSTQNNEKYLKEKVKTEPKSNGNLQAGGIDNLIDEKDQTITVIDPNHLNNTVLDHNNDSNSNNNIDVCDKENDLETGELFISLDPEIETVAEVAIQSCFSD